MGKRSKEGLKDNDGSRIDGEVKKIKKVKKQIQNADATTDLSQPIKNKKSKKIIFDDDGAPLTPKEIPQNSTTLSKKQQNKKSSNKKNKKMFFGDDAEESHEKNNSTDNKKSQANPNHDEVKDEDIDKFCDEIDDEDNAQYENWVKLIEAKLSSNKKNS